MELVFGFITAILGTILSLIVGIIFNYVIKSSRRIEKLEDRIKSLDETLSNKEIGKLANYNSKFTLIKQKLQELQEHHNENKDILHLISELNSMIMEIHKEVYTLKNELNPILFKTVISDIDIIKKYLKSKRI